MRNTIKDTQDYIDAPELKLPIKSDNGFEVQELICNCNSCHKPTKDLKGYVNHVFNCIELSFGGVCMECKLITIFRMRFYPETDEFMIRTDEGWTRNRFYHPFSFKSFFKKLFGIS